MSVAGIRFIDSGYELGIVTDFQSPSGCGGLTLLPYMVVSSSNPLVARI